MKIHPTIFFGSLLALLVVGCASVGTSPALTNTNSPIFASATAQVSATLDGVAALTEVSTRTPQPYRFGNPVENELQALVAAKPGLKTSFGYVEPLGVVSAEELSYDEAGKIVGSSAEPRPAGVVWLIIYHNNEWQYLTHNPRYTPDPPFRGCVFVIIDARDGALIGVGPLGDIDPNTLPLAADPVDPDIAPAIRAKCLNP